jgi:hypothetical protein
MSAATLPAAPLIAGINGIGWTLDPGSRNTDSEMATAAATAASAVEGTVA